MEEYRTVLGTYTGTKIVQGQEEIDARAYVSKRIFMEGKYGFFLIKLNEGWNWWVIVDYIPYKDK